jgi:hypothetical protein
MGTHRRGQKERNKQTSSEQAKQIGITALFGIIVFKRKDLK